MLDGFFCTMVFARGAAGACSNWYAFVWWLSWCLFIAEARLTYDVAPPYLQRAKFTETENQIPPPPAAAVAHVICSPQLLPTPSRTPPVLHSPRPRRSLLFYNINRRSLNAPTL